MQMEEETKGYLTKPDSPKMAVKMEAGKNHTHTAKLEIRHIHTHTRLTAPLPGTTRVSRYHPGEPVPKGKTNLNFTEARDSEWQWHQLGHVQVCTSLQTDNYSGTPPLSFYRPYALPAAQPRASKH